MPQFDVLQWIIFSAIVLICIVNMRADSEPFTLRHTANFAVLGIPAVLLLLYAMKAAPGLWWSVASNQLHLAHPFQWNDWFQSIPFNDGLFVREWFHHPAWDNIMRWVYNYGFYFPLWLPLIRSFMLRDTVRIMRYTFAGHLLQYPLIILFYQTILLQEVWYVLGMPDLLQRSWSSESEKLVYVMNCMPSMHTSIAFAMLLLARREKDAVFRNFMTVYGALIIYSTLYLRIHWVLDVAAGMVFAYAVVKLTDFLIDRVPSIASLAMSRVLRVRRQWR
ncbi:phosphatase PAP2 family protein [Paenibacillus turpanensis]|uniref:phosphatase PAP2 family protein n=1 Tax=Paenibacillus turpanensis TaxID=2689078 RepID=UPI00140E847E|nr:phosphatase PAP2 family protein [Paenibacillus turpanensis]